VTTNGEQRQRGGERRVRDAGDEDATAPTIAAVGDRWAVLVGISRYQASGLNLRYARRDAEELHALLSTPEGGNFHPDRVRLLVDETGTTAAVIRALRGFLMAALPEDLVLLYFACHGGADPRRPGGPLYLYTHDTDPADVAGTGLPMDDIDRSLRYLIRAERAVIIMDTCHSGAVASGLRATGRAEATNRYLEALARARGGVALFTSAEASESSEEDARWGGGHGVFTHYLLKGMRGAADGYRGRRDGIVAVGELFEYVRDQVQNATEGRQHPAIGAAPFDRGLPMAITAELDVDQHLALARGLTDVGWRLDDPAPFLLAARQFALAADLKRRLPRADAGRGSALLAAGRAAEAAQVLQVAIATAPDELDAEVWLDLGIALAETGRAGLAAGALREYAHRSPDGDEAGWATAYATWLDGGRKPRLVRALIFGVGDFPDGTMPLLPGVAGDLVLMREALHAASGGTPCDVTLLQDQGATRESVLAALTALGTQVGPDDVVVVYFTGHSNDKAALDEPYLITSMTDAGPVGLSARELVDALNLPAHDVLLILDTHVSAAMVQYARQATSSRLALLLACAVGEVAYELSIDGRMHGAFTYALVQAMSRLEVTSRGQLIDAVRIEIVQLWGGSPLPRPQTPLLIGARSVPVLSGGFPAAGLWRTARRRTARPDEIEDLHRRCAEVPAPLAVWALGRALLARGDAEGGRRELKRAQEALRHPHPDLSIDLAEAALESDDRDAAVAALRAAVAGDGGTGPIADALVALTTPGSRPPAVLVVGADPDTVALGAAAAAPLIAEVLGSVPGLAGADFVTVAGPAATRTRILDEATELARRAGRQLAVLVVLGASSERGAEPVLYVSDGVLPLTGLAAALGTATAEEAHNLVSILDLLPALTSAARDIADITPVHRPREVALPGTTVRVLETVPPQPGLAAADFTGDALRALLAALPAMIVTGRSYRTWVTSAALPPSATADVRGSRADGRVLEDPDGDDPGPPPPRRRAQGNGGGNRKVRQRGDRPTRGQARGVPGRLPATWAGSGAVRAAGRRVGRAAHRT
jgi:uncharacterized caspase-like protein